MATNSLQVVSVLLSDPEANLHSVVFASRPGIASAHLVADTFPQRVAKVVIDIDSIAPGDFVVSSVVAGSKRKIEILAIDKTGLGLSRLLEKINPVESSHVTSEAIEIIECVDGHTVVILPEAFVLASSSNR